MTLASDGSGPAGGDDPLLVLAPHADDELLGAGALIRSGSAAGRAMLVASLTDGSASHPARVGLSAIREAEQMVGLHRMVAGAGAVPRVLHLRQPDGRFDAQQVDLGDAAPLGAWLGAHPGATVLAPDPDDAHCDHQAAFALGARIVAGGQARRLVVMPISQRLDPVAAGGVDPPAGRFAPFQVDAATAAIKRHAIAAHHSQCIDTGDGFHLAPAMIAPFLREERFALVHDRDAPEDGAVPPGHFDTLFSASPDPWDYDAAPDEAERRAATLAAAGLTGDASLSILELGCANGAMTSALVPHAARLVAVDASAAAIGHARARLARAGAGSARVTLLEAPAPAILDRPGLAPPGGFDRIFLSDMLYYLGFAGVVATAQGAARLCAPGGRIIIAAYRGDTQCRLTGAMAAGIAIASLPGWKRQARVTTSLAHIDVLERP